MQNDFLCTPTQQTGQLRPGCILQQGDILVGVCRDDADSTQDTTAGHRASTSSIMFGAVDMVGWSSFTGALEAIAEYMARTLERAAVAIKQAEDCKVDDLDRYQIHRIQPTAKK